MLYGHYHRTRLTRHSSHAKHWLMPSLGFALLLFPLLTLSRFVLRTSAREAISQPLSTGYHSVRVPNVSGGDISCAGCHVRLNPLQILFVMVFHGRESIHRPP